MISNEGLRSVSPAAAVSSSASPAYAGSSRAGRRRRGRAGGVVPGSRRRRAPSGVWVVHVRGSSLSESVRGSFYRDKRRRFF